MIPHLLPLAVATADLVAQRARQSVTLEKARRRSPLGADARLHQLLTGLRWFMLVLQPGRR
ncbi:MAG: hypothetical protein ABS75_09215 [Pelagibacterium sp. SCN 63-23]|nr:MAG: hypothetical protein ABS75_09215 [Pelagibacterium sp. SCN 63-23]